jgi:CheY-like chemotaxis protein
MEAVGQLTSGIAHDFNNLLTAITGNLHLIEEDTAEEAVRKYARSALRGAKRGAELTQQLLAFSRNQHLDVQPNGVNQLVSGMSDLLLRTLGGTIRIELALGQELWPALIDTNQVENAILNLAINARDAMPTGGTLTIETTNLRVGRLNEVDGLDPGDYVVVSVADTGTGMSEEVKAKAFDPFFTTKEVGRGSGLGLSQVYGVARQLGGTAEIDSAPGRGTTVRIFLPRAHKAANLPADPRSATAARDGNVARILLVDDDADVREIVTVLLRRLGHDVVSAGSGAAALSAIEATVFDAAILDFAMPEMTGAELARRIGSRRPDVPILLITGHVDSAALGGDFSEEKILRKPFRAAELESKLRMLLEHRASAEGGNVVRLRPQAG